jgi:hypothetical protein
MIRSDQDLLWLHEADTDLFGHPSVPSEPGQRHHPVYVLPAGGGGAVDSKLEGLAAAVTDLLQVPHIRARLSKLLRAPTDEHHLMIWLRDGGIPISQYLAMVAPPEALPRISPIAPEGLSHLWLSTGYGTSLFSWSADGWAQHDVFDQVPPSRPEPGPLGQV